MAEGYDGALMVNQWTFLVFEGISLMIATTALMIFHPGPAFGSFWNIPKSKEDIQSGETDGSEVELQSISRSKRFWKRNG